MVQWVVPAWWYVSASSEAVYGAAQAAKRALKNKALGYLSALDDPKISTDLLERARSATNMTDQIAALAGLCDSDCERYTLKCSVTYLPLV